MSDQATEQDLPAVPVAASDETATREFPPNNLGAAALILSISGLLIPIVSPITGLLGIGLGIGSLVRSRRSRGQRGGVGIAAIVIGLLGLGLCAFVILRFIAPTVAGSPA